MITDVKEQCMMPDGILYYRIAFDEQHSGWVDIDYLAWRKP